MICKVCGRTIQNEEANFCEYCGTSFRDGFSSDNNYGVNASEAEGAENVVHESVNEEPSGNLSWSERFKMLANGNQGRQQENTSAEQIVPFWQWLAVMLLPMIPVVGAIAYLILLFVWAFGAGTAPTKKNWARASLVFLVISFFFLGSLLGGSMGQFMGVE